MTERALRLSHVVVRIISTINIVFLGFSAVCTRYFPSLDHAMVNVWGFWLCLFDLPSAIRRRVYMILRNDIRHIQLFTLRLLHPPLLRAFRVPVANRSPFSLCFVASFLPPSRDKIPAL
jgi:hypothetical protein